MKIAILLSTYNAQEYLEEQLNSLLVQTYSRFEIIVRDDGSTDDTLKILELYDIILLKSKVNTGAQRSFSALLEYAFWSDKYEYFMFCDQDDIWCDDKIEKTLLKMQELELEHKETPLLIHTDLKVVDSKMKNISESFWEFENINPNINSLNRLLMQNTITGCTVMINKRLAKISFPFSGNCIAHDWWLGLVASTFGKTAYVSESLIMYRQHDNNAIGAQNFDFKYVFDNYFKVDILKLHILQAKAFLEVYRDKLDDKTIFMLEDFSNMNNKSFFQKRVILLKYKLFKQGFLRNLGLFLKI